ncbi:MAG: DUF1501 domain-containing protein [Planctomycetia bacterium]|nr:DUF1501 domain-containing protein [Planctomycetia bacterium]
MLTVRTPRSARDCDGTTRRDFLRVGSLAVGGLTLPDLLRARAQAATSASAPRRPTRDTSVVLLWLGGGPTHIETFDPKTSAPSEYRSAVGAVDTSVPGIQLGGGFTQMAKVADKMAFVRSFAHKNSGHGGGTHFVMTGYDFAGADQGQKSIKPSYGSITARYRGASNLETGMPTYVKLGGNGAEGAAFLGKTYAPFETGGQARANMNLTLAADRVNDRRSLLSRLDRLNRDVDVSGLMQGFDSFEQQAYGLILGGAKNAFDVRGESPKLREQYGSGLGEQMLQARRLCEAGCGFVTVTYGGWDMHGNVASGMKTRGPTVDQAVSAFVEDCAERGLSEKVLLVVTGEFGRTPRINKNAGRDHWAPLSTLALAGGGLRMGQTVGESTAKAEVPKSTPIGPQDLMATLFHVLGLPRDLHYNDPAGRPVPMLDSGKPIAELL